MALMLPFIALVIPYDWAGLCLLLAFITLFVVVMLHMLSISFSMPSITAFAKSEYAQVGVSVLIVVFAILMLNAGNNVAGEVTAAIAAQSGHIVLTNVANTPAYANDPIIVAQQYLLQGPIDCEKWAYWLIFYKNIIPEVASSVSFSVGNVEGVSGAYLFSGYVSMAHYLAQNLTYLVLFQYIQYYALEFAKYTMLQIFLPIGLVLRAFPVTRGAGGLMIGFALGFAFIFPITYVLIIAMMPSTDYMCSQVIKVQATAAPALGEENPCFNNEASVMAAVYQKKTDKTVEKVWTDIISTVGQYYQQALFYPMIALIITFTFIRQTGALFGADLAEIGRGLIKII
jgi:hypothetical protein